MARLRLSAAPAALVLLLAACVPPPRPVPPAPPAPAPAPAPAQPAPVASALAATPATADWTLAPVTPGDWAWRKVAGESMAEFRSPRGDVLAQIACTGAPRQVALALAGAAASDVTVRTETTSRALAATVGGGFVRAMLAPHDPLLDAIAFSRGRFALEAGTHALYLPSYPEITRVVEDCR